MSQHILRSNDFRSPSIDPVRRDVSLVSSGAYGLDDLSGCGVQIEPIPHGLAAGISTRSYPSSLEDPIVTSQTQDLCARISPMPAINPDLLYERPPSQRRVDGLPVSPGESNILFVDGLPTDCTRREVGLSTSETCRSASAVRAAEKEGKGGDLSPRDLSSGGLQGLNLGSGGGSHDLTYSTKLICLFSKCFLLNIHLVFFLIKNSHLVFLHEFQSGDKAMVLCFVEFNDSKCALTAMNALQGYKFDDKKPKSSVLRIHFVHFPFRLPSEHDDQRLGTR